MRFSIVAVLLLLLLPLDKLVAQADTALLRPGARVRFETRTEDTTLGPQYRRREGKLNKIANDTLFVSGGPFAKWAIPKKTITLAEVGRRDYDKAFISGVAIGAAMWFVMGNDTLQGKSRQVQLIASGAALAVGTAFIPYYRWIRVRP